MKRSILFRAALLLTAFIVCVPTMAEKISVAQARTIAKRFTGKAFSLRTATPQSVSPALSLAYKSGAEELYAFNVGQGSGFVLVAGDDLVKNPVLGYCDNGSFNYEQLEGPAKGWVEQYARTIAYARANNIVVESSAALESGSTKEVGPLLTTKWAQYSPYDLACPFLGGIYTDPGCEAVAMAQIMKYHNYPRLGIGSFGYSDSLVSRDSVYHYSVYADFENTVYDWDDMPDVCDSNSTAAQTNAVTTLVYHCGVALRMSYDWLTSGTTDDRYLSAFVKYFDYDKGLQYELLDYYTLAEWTDLLKADLDAGRPVLYRAQKSSSGGRAFVMDGYNAEGYFHFNWGWGGKKDGYYSLLKMQPYDWMKGYTESQRALLHIMPDKGGAAKVELLTSGMYSKRRTVNLDTCDNKVLVIASFGFLNVARAVVSVYLTLENKAGGGTQDLAAITGILFPWETYLFEKNEKCNFTGVKDGDYKLYLTYETENVSKRKVRSWNVYQGYLDVTVKGNIVTFGDNELTGINEVTNTPNAAAKGDGSIYNLWGQKAGTDWEKLSPGIYLKDGEKILKE